MLTKSDLSQIKGIVTEVVQVELEPIKKDIKILKRNDVKIRKDINLVIDSFDRDVVELRGKIEKVEKHIGLVKN